MTEVGSVYGEALYLLCQEDGLAQQVLAALGVLEESFGDAPEFIRLLDSPALSKAQRCEMIDNSFRSQLHPYLLNFLKILTEKGYTRYFRDCCSAYRDRFNQAHNILCVSATTAEKLTQAQARRLTEKLSALTGKTVQLTNRVDSAVLGGVRLDYSGKRLEDTIALRLDSIRNRLKNTVL